MDNIKVSVLMNCFNGEAFVEVAIRSILAQDFHNWELVFWDNLSTDNSAEIFQSFNDKRLKYHLAPRHTTLGEARALAWGKLTGDVVAILDTDDVWLPNKLSQQLKAFLDPDVGIVISNTLFFDENRSVPLYGAVMPPNGYVFENLIKNYFISLETVLLRRSAVNTLEEAFDKDFDNISDFDLIVRLSKQHKLAVVPQVLSGWRIHENNATFKDRLKFVNERQRWAQKQLINDQNFFGSNKVRDSFLAKNALRGALICLTSDNKVDAVSYFSRGPFSKSSIFLFKVFCLVPYSSLVVRVATVGFQRIKQQVKAFKSLS